MSNRLAIIADDLHTEPSLTCLLPAQAELCHCQLRSDSSAPEKIREFKPDLVILLPAADRSRALAMFQSLPEWDLAAPALAVLAPDSDPELLQRVADTADDFIFWPPRKDELQGRIGRLLGKSPRDLDMVREQLTQELSLAQLVGRDPAFLKVIRHIPLLAKSDAPVLLLGETGTGKESCARAIHHLSPRNSRPFIPVDCGALPEHLAENELFGHVRGAFTGALAEQKGLAAMAEGGTLFLDEVDSLSLTVQAKLLRFLEDHTYRALGADRFSHVNVRVLAATNHDFETCVREKRFRQDLYFRLNVLQLRLPALRERRQDIALLAGHFVESLRRPGETPPKRLSASAQRSLDHYPWPGNVRELFNVVQRAMVLATDPQILPHHLGLPDCAGDSPAPVSFREGKAKALAAYERLYIEEMLRKYQGNITRAAREARQDRRAFGRLVKKHALDRRAV
ncbi:MAG TPA: sigma-54 dependent transcriptional regulator [Terriglobia bacterium]|nr:sigma-54 dependent transcriptional regulator [Terriglobia bacterium]